MREKTGTETGSSRPSPLVLVTDPSVEGATLVHALRTQGFRVLDVPVALLAGALAADRVSAIVVDIDQPGAIQTIVAALARPESGSPRVFVIGDLETARAAGEALDSAGVFPRPIDVDAIAARVSDLEPSDSRSSLRGLAASPSVAPRRETLRPGEGLGSGFPAALDLEGPSLLGELDEDEALLFEHEAISVSPDLETVLAQAAERARLSLSLVPSSHEPDVDVVLEPHQVELLEEPLDSEDEDPRPARTAAGSLSSLPPLREEPSEGLDSLANPAPAGGLERAPVERRDTPTGPPEGGPARQGLRVPRPPPAPALQAAEPSRGDAVDRAAAPPESIPPTIAPKADTTSRKRVSLFPPASMTRPDALETRAEALRPREAVRVDSQGADLPPRPSDARPGAGRGRSEPEPPAYAALSAAQVERGRVMPAAFGPGEAPKLVAAAIASRLSGCLTLESQEGGARVTRRLVLHEGDLVTAVSDAEGEAIVPFLAGRGDLPRALVPSLDRRIPPFGRLAGAALIAQGHLGQDDLWVVLRAHAEWVLTRMLASPAGSARTDPEPPGRLGQEPNVFGGAAGSEVFLENLRRALDPSQALAWLGGREARVSRGSRPELLVECALAPDEAELTDSASGARLLDVVPGHEVDYAPLFFGLACLGAIEILAPARREPRDPSPAHDPLDNEAIRKRVEARVALAMEGDYFAVLGIARDATAYEIKRRYLELRRAFEPSRLLTGETADLAADVVLVLEVLDEAYDVLREPYRRDRYRRALEAGPPGLADRPN